jgi:hypothetical protein
VGNDQVGVAPLEGGVALVVRQHVAPVPGQ